MEIKDILKSKREELGMSCEEEGKKIGVSASTISRWESGDIANMRRDKIAKLAEVLHISPAVIMGWEEPEEKPAYYLDPETAEMAQELFERPEMRVLFDASRKATKEDIEQVADILKKLSGK